MSIFDNNPRPIEDAPACVAEVIPFPSLARVHKVEYTIQRLMGPGTAKQKARWREQIYEGIENQFRAVGVPPEKAVEQRNKFEIAVETEITRRRRAWGLSEVDGDGAA
ncbi:DUF6074 family protein [Mangrovibrevibacter kandeliae]|uniref:DUF6074 family protein n=1 Tax=Mangrovibrevibacter kandeliae TaxID=2968473 RepID=UPI0021195D32|nr:DUF6074 family protein [Aurantimonas sp. CSK15Z-1]MCQ8781669.1 DUF6074 family protein [Aurantimonas sp. CSK15Z-1]